MFTTIALIHSKSVKIYNHRVGTPNLQNAIEQFKKSPNSGVHSLNLEVKKIYQ